VGTPHPDRDQLSFGEPLLLTAEQAARRLGLTAHWVYEAARRGELPCVRIGRKVRFIPADLDAYVQAKRAGARRRSAGNRRRCDSRPTAGLRALISQARRARSRRRGTGTALCPASAASMK
jgi:excisionase family DNA binding protein